MDTPARIIPFLLIIQVVILLYVIGWRRLKSRLPKDGLNKEIRFQRSKRTQAPAEEEPGPAIPAVRFIRWSLTGEQLIGALKPNLYEANPFRVLGLGPNATPEEINSRYRAIRVGVVEKAYDDLSGVQRILSPDNAEKAAQYLQDPVNRFFSWLFWFWGNEGTDAPGLVALHDSAIRLHGRALAKSGTNLTLADETRMWNLAIDKWQHLLSRDDFVNAVREKAEHIGDPRFSHEVLSSILACLPPALLHINGELAVDEVKRGDNDRAYMHANITGYYFTLVDRSKAQNACVAGVRTHLGHLVHNFEKEESETDPLGASRKLLAAVEKPIYTLRLLLPEDHPALGLHCNAVAEALSNALIRYGNATRDWAGVLPLFKRAENLCTGPVIEARFEKNRRTVERLALK